MSLRLTPYLDYKDAGLLWLSEVPTTWTQQRLDRLFTLRNEPPKDGDQRVTGYLDGRVTLRSNVKGQKIKGVIKEAGWQRVYPGDFAISGMNAHLGGMGVSDSLGKCSPIYLVLKPNRGTNAQYVSRAVRHMAHMGALKVLVNTIRFNSADFKRDDLKSIRVWLPPLHEQERIVALLQHFDRRISRLINAKRRLLKLLDEQKQVIIHRAVTRGLDPDVRLKASGVDWLGDVPEHWEVEKLTRLAQRITKGTTPTTLGRDFTDSGVRFVKVESISNSLTVTNEKCAFIDTHTDTLLSRSRLKAGDILVAIAGAIGRVAIVKNWNLPANTNQAVGIVTPLSDRIDPHWCAVYISSPLLQRFLSDSSVQSAQANLSLGSLRKIPVLLPPIDEQKELVFEIMEQTQAVDKAGGRTRREIEILHEYRTRLIADVVTGKLDVRGVELPELDEIEDLAGYDVDDAEAEVDETEENTDGDE